MRNYVLHLKFCVSSCLAHFFLNFVWLHMPPFSNVCYFSKCCFLLERQAQFRKSLVCKGSKKVSIWPPKLSETYHFRAYCHQICPYIYLRNSAGTRATGTFPKRKALEAHLGMNFVCHLLFLLCTYRSTQ